ncbi:MAG: SRPBCC domain-containing protein [Devosia sp.]
MADRVSLSIQIEAPPSEVWGALTMPDLVKRYMMGATLVTDWKVGHPILWRGEVHGRTYEDKGTIVDMAPERRLVVTHWSPLSGLPDAPGSYHTVSYELEPQLGGTLVTLTQENLTGLSPEQAKKNWQPVLDGLKKVAEGEKP